MKQSHRKDGSGGGDWMPPRQCAAMAVYEVAIQARALDTSQCLYGEGLHYFGVAKVGSGKAVAV